MRLLLLASVLSATALVACGQSLTGNQTGTGGVGSSMGAGGAGALKGSGGAVTGTGGSSLQMLCDTLATEYQYAVTAAQSCTLGAASQCQLAVPAVLAVCGSCPTLVNDDTKPKAIQAQWQAAGCLTARPPVPCVQVLCIAPPSMCVANDTGGASCAFVSGAGGSGGSSGKGGSSGTDGGVSACDALAQKYQTALTAAQTCTVGASNQCAELVPEWLSVCGACPVYVNDATLLTEIHTAWNQAGCDSQVDIACPAVDCVSQTSECNGPPGGTGGCIVTGYTGLGAP